MSIVLNPLTSKFDVVIKDHTKLKNIGTNSHSAIDNFITSIQTEHTDTLGPQGWIPEQDWVKATVSIQDTTKLELVITSTTNIAYYWRGNKTDLGTTTLTVRSTIDKAEGIWYCYSMDGTNFVLNQTPFYIYDNINGSIRADLMVWEFYWDNTNNTTIWIQPEFHNNQLSRGNHGYMHESFGTRYSNGLDMSYGTTAANNDTRVKITSGEIHDEDISCYITHKAVPTAIWEQILGSVGTADANYAALPIYYLSGATPVWRKTTTSSYPFLPVSNNYIYYNRDNVGTWDYTTSAGSSSFIVYWVVGTTNQSEPAVIIPGRRDNANLTAAQAEPFPNLATLFTEFKLLYRIIYQTSSSNSNNGKCKINSVVDYRRDAISNNSSATSTPSAALVSFTPTATIAATNVQAAIEEVVTDADASYLKLDLSNDPLTGASLDWNGDAARQIAVARNATANTAGVSLTVKSGSATTGATDKAAGDLILSTGTSTGSGTSNIIFSTAAPLTTGTTDRTPAERVRISGRGFVGINQPSPTTLLDVNGSINATTAVRTPVVRPPSDSTSSFGIFDSTQVNAIINIDSTNLRVGINNLTPSQALNVTGNILASGTVTGSNLSGTNTGNQVVPANEAGTASNFLTAYNSSTGAWTKAQPTWANIDKTTSAVADIADVTSTTEFTPTVQGTTGAGTGTYSVQEGRYYQVGKLIFVQIEMTWSAHDGTGNIRVAGLPFNSSNSGIDTPLAVYWSNLTLTATDSKVLARVTNNAATVTIQQIQSGAAGAIAIDTAGSLSLGGCYIAA